MTAFDRALAFVLRHEGEYVHDPRDPGGETKYGISKRAYPTLDIQALTREQAAAIYRRDYWDAVRGDALPEALAVAVFDAAVNLGVSRAIKMLQRALDVRDDGVFGPKTLKAAQKATGTLTLGRLLTERVLYYTQLPTWSRFGAGWTARVIALAQETA